MLTLGTVRSPVVACFQLRFRATCVHARPVNINPHCCRAPNHARTSTSPFLRLWNTSAGGRPQKSGCQFLHKRLMYVPRNENLVLVTMLPFNRLEYQRRSPWPVRVGAPQNQTSPRAFPQTSLPRHLFFRRELICPRISFYVGTEGLAGKGLRRGA